MQRAAFVIAFMVAVHSMLEYPLWYAYFLLPTAFAFGLCVERIDPALLARERDDRPANVDAPVRSRVDVPRPRRDAGPLRLHAGRS